MKTGVIIVAGGSGKRMNSSIAKQYLELRGKSILARTVEVFDKAECVDEIVIVVGENDVASVKENIVDRYEYTKVKTVTAGGSERQYSVANGLKALSDDVETVMIHDGVRPFVTERLMRELLKNISDEVGVLPAVRVKETVKVCDEDGFITDTPDRSKLWLAQTPQCFTKKAITGAYEAAERDGILGTDDSMLAERVGIRMRVIEGDYANIKITTPDDLDIACNIADRVIDGHTEIYT
jgi:2-C-methyl-D-erythritol 4-phosphate cytidylyltransferase